MEEEKISSLAHCQVHGQGSRTKTDKQSQSMQMKGLHALQQIGHIKKRKTRRNRGACVIAKYVSLCVSAFLVFSVSLLFVSLCLSFSPPPVCVCKCSQRTTCVSFFGHHTPVCLAAFLSAMVSCLGLGILNCGSLEEIKEERGR